MILVSGELRKRHGDRESICSTVTEARAMLELLVAVADIHPRTLDRVDK